jgi:hypothetical protein
LFGESADEDRSGEGADRHGAADEAEFGAIVSEYVDHEGDEQHDEAALGDLRDAMDRKQACEWRMCSNGS